jgi:hypothetical protein
MAWIDRAARRAAASDAPDRLIGLVERRDLTRRQALKGFAAGALLAGPAGALLSTPDARGASCLRVDPTCARDAEQAFNAAIGACKRDSLWSELGCRVKAQNALTAARHACRVPDHSRCPAGRRCDGSGACVAGDPSPAPPEDEDGPVGTGPCAHDWPSAASLAAARAASAAGAPVVDLSAGGCIRLERSGDTERLTVAGAVVSELVTSATGTTTRRDDDRDGFFEVTAKTEDGRAEIVRRDPATRAVVRRETRTIDGDEVHVIVEEHGEVVQQFKTGRAGHSSGVSASGLLGYDPQYCGAERDKEYNDLMNAAVQKLTACLEKKGRGDIALELMDAYARSQILCEDIEGAYAAAIDSQDGRGYGRVVVNPGAMAELVRADQLRVMGHELLHYTSLGLHDSAHSEAKEESRWFEGDRVYACTSLCLPGYSFGQPNKCSCATCLETNVCDGRCAEFNECQDPNLGAICPCLLRNKWYPTFEECAVDCSSGLACFGFSKCRNLSRKC